jgi:N-acetylglucosamine-6-phosphate deacetylase
VSKGILVGIGHSQASYEEALEAIEYGASWGTHVFNAMPALTHRDPGIVGALLTNDKVKVGLIVDGIHIHPAICKLVVMTKKARGICLVSDAISAAGMPPGQYSLGDQKIVVDQTSSRLEDGRFAGSILSLDQAVRNLVSFQASNLEDALLMASTIPAEILTLRTKGKIRQGFDADLVVLDQDLNVAMTMVSGEMVYQRESDWIKL